jgi:hypothetical protein
MFPDDLIIKMIGGFLSGILYIKDMLFPVVQIFPYALIHFKIKDYCKFFKEMMKETSNANTLENNFCYAFYCLKNVDRCIDSAFLLESGSLIANNEFLVKKALLKGANLKYASERLKNTKSIAKLVSCKKTWRTWHLLKNTKIVLSNNFIHLSDKYKRNDKYLKSVIDYNGLMLEYASNELKKDNNFVNKAIFSEPSAFEFALNEYKENIDNINLHFKDIGYFFKYLPEKFKSDPEFISRCLSTHFYILQHLSEDFINQHMNHILCESTFFSFIQYLAINHENIKQLKINMDHVFELFISKNKISHEIFLDVINESLRKHTLFMFEHLEKGFKPKGNSKNTFSELFSFLLRKLSNQKLNDYEDAIVKQWKESALYHTNQYCIECRFVVDNLEKLFANEKYRRGIEAIEMTTPNNSTTKKKSRCIPLQLENPFDGVLSYAN